MVLEKHYIDANTLLLDAFKLGVAIYNSGFKPDFIVGVWRGGTPVGIAIQEILAYLGNDTDHIAIRTSSYEGIADQRHQVQVHGLSYLIRHINAEDKLLLVDDVFDTGKSMQAIIDALQLKSRKNTPHDIRVATPWFKPNNNKTQLTPDFYLHQTDDWLIFPHEMDGLSREEILANKPGMKAIFSQIKV